MIYIGWGVEIYLSACLIGKCFFHLGKRLFGLHGIFGSTTKLLKFSSFYLNFICSCLLLRCYSMFSYLLLKHPVCIRCVLTYTGGKKSACQKIGSAASSSYYTSMLLPANLIGQPQASLPPARPSSPRLNIQARERTTVAFQ